MKISGDMLSDDVLNWIKEMSREYFIVVCVGGGTHINQAFEEAGFEVGKHGPLGRETKSFKERQLARDVLERNQADIQDRLNAIGVRANVIIPVLDIGTVLCHVNGDQFVLTVYLGFDVLYVVTTKDRLEAKNAAFEPYPKIKVIAF